MGVRNLGPVPSRSKKRKRTVAASYPIDIREGLARLNEVGRASVRGISFDLCPEKTLHMGWQAWLPYGLFGQWSSQRVVLPWKYCGPQTELEGERFHVLAGDCVHVLAVEQRTLGTELDHPLDRERLTIKLGVKRENKIIELRDPVYFYKANSLLLPAAFVQYKTAAHRVLDLLGYGDMSIDLYGNDDPRTDDVRDGPCPPDRNKTEWECAQAARLAIFFVSFIEGRFSEEIDKPSKEAVLKDFDSIATYAATVGCYLAKAQFSVHLPDVLMGKRRRATSQKTGQVRADAQIEMADKTWRADAFLMSKTLRSKNPKLGQKSLARRLIPELTSRGRKPPDEDTVVRQIRVWEKAGTLERSSTYRALSRG